MGANAQTTVPTFAIGQVLEAAQLNQSARTGVPVFAGTTERDAAFGGTGEKALAEGQLCYLESTNVVQYYDGASWATVGPTTSGVIQVKATTKTDTFTMASQTYADVTGLSVSITPTSTANKVLVFTLMNGYGTDGSNQINMRLMRDSTVIGVGDVAGNRIQASGYMGNDMNQAGIIAGVAAVLDSPNTTSATTYKVQIARSTSNATSVFINRSQSDTDNNTFTRTASSIIVMEVAP